MFWRQDTIDGVGLHVMCCVTKDLEKPFAEAMDSTRLLKRTSEMEAFFESCLVEPPAKGRKKGKTGKK